MCLATCTFTGGCWNSKKVIEAPLPPNSNRASQEASEKEKGQCESK